MIRRHGRFHAEKTCGECINFEAIEDEDRFEEFFRCKRGPCSGFEVQSWFPACRLFRSEWQLERETLESLGQMRMYPAA